MEEKRIQEELSKYLSLRDNLWNYRSRRNNLYFDETDEFELKILKDLEMTYERLDERSRTFITNSGIAKFGQIISSHT